MPPGRSNARSPRGVEDREPAIEPYETILETVSDGVYVLDDDGSFEYANEAYCELTGYDREDLLGMRAADVLRDELVERLTGLIERLRAGEIDEATIEAELSTADGDRVRVESQLTLLPDGDAPGTVGVVRDIGGRVERKRELEETKAALETEREFVDTALDRLDDIFYVIDTDGALVRWNEQLPARTGYSDEELDGMDALELLAPEDHEMIAEAIEAVYAGDEPPNPETELVTKDGERLPVSINGSELDEDGEPLGIVGTARDITRQKERERELQRYEVLFEESTDVNAVLDADGTFRHLTPSIERVLGYEPDDLVGADAFEYVHPDDRETVEETFAELLEEANRGDPVEFRFRRADGSWAVLEAGARNLLDDPDIEGVVVYTREVTWRKERERELERHRERLAALNNLNAVVREITGALIRQSTREEIEGLVCEQLAASNSYAFAWIGEVEPHGEAIRSRAAAGASGYLDDAALSIDPDDPSGASPTARALRTREMQIVRDADGEPDYPPWRERAEAFGYRSAAAIPLAFEGTVYGVLTVYTARADAFTGEERQVVRHLGETVGHAIGAIERKQALTSDEIVELEFQAERVLEAFGVEEPAEGTITFKGTVPLGDGEFVQYGQATDDAVETLSALVDRVDHWEELSIIDDEFDGVRFELRLSEPLVVSTVAEYNGRVKTARLADGTFELVVQLPPSADIRHVTEAVTDSYPDMAIAAQRRTTRRRSSSARVRDAFVDDVTERQQTVLEAAYFAGFFDWPRKSTGEDLAAALGISAATFHEHVRNGERKLLAALLDGETAE